MPRFAIVAHDYPHPHLDLFLESGDLLRSWRLPPSFEHGQTFPVEPMADHRPLYLDYEGPVSNERGTVVNVDRGTFAWVQDDPHQVMVQLAGKRFAGSLVITADPQGHWVARFDPDCADSREVRNA